MTVINNVAENLEAGSAVIYNTRGISNLRVMQSVSRTRLKKERCLQMPYGSFENEDQSTKHPNLENEAPKSQKRSTQNSKPL